MTEKDNKIDTSRDEVQRCLTSRDQITLEYRNGTSRVFDRTRLSRFQVTMQSIVFGATVGYGACALARFIGTTAGVPISQGQENLLSFGSAAAATYHCANLIMDEQENSPVWTEKEKEDKSKQSSWPTLIGAYVSVIGMGALVGTICRTHSV